MNPSGSVPHLDDHLTELSTFLTLHITNLTALKNQLVPSAHSALSDAAAEVNPPTDTHLADQFNIIVVTATFTGGVIISFLSLMNDVLMAAGVPLSPVSPFILGLRFGIVGFGLNLAVAMFAGVNSALATQSRGDPTRKARDQRMPMVICSWGQFIASIFAGVSIFLLTFAFDPRVAVTTGGCYLASLILSTYYSFRRRPWKQALHHDPLAAASLTISTVAFGLSTIYASTNSYALMPAFALTLLYHVVVLFQAGFYRVIPRLMYLLLLCGLWGTGVAITVMIPGFTTSWRLITLCSLSSIECVIIAIIAFTTFSTRTHSKTLPEEGVMMLGTNAP